MGQSPHISKLQFNLFERIEGSPNKRIRVLLSVWFPVQGFFLKAILRAHEQREAIAHLNSAHQVISVSTVLKLLTSSAHLKGCFRHINEFWMWLI